MNPDVKSDWVAALLSKKFQQGTGQLYDSKTNIYCCLGVLNCVLGYDFVHDGCLTTYGDQSVTGLLESVGIPYEYYGTFVRMNDYHRLSFDRIADYIEKTL